ncbi:MAG: threonine ammonia-lyase [Methanothrix sp.]|jgi:threonine dehydratase|uniref:threonine ammonia-lyase n=1 Tax=Methanothrix harundinacea TaxID=301375 RepID=A0A117MCQ0_9EURY|nr:MAG: L-threonine ammonia-lyase [Methanothrix harundinacea]MDD2638219.1 threonine ammonia-lyase [Methanothrix sp.]MDI9398164.1 threonine ammonia-lyase [Euryarchaeota archaeon]KUK96777.1 MAG: L-threonine ammonia-lyase [Methanothrix harundinacea]MCP1392419.1 threonine ammonia-lyase [Methanothrix harundinacea]
MITLEDIRKAALLIEGSVIRTPLVRSPTFSRMAEAEVYLKLEGLQKGGSFKVRGATYKVLKRREEIGPAGVVAASAGNHAQGVALAAKAAGVPATIVMPIWASMAKQEATLGYGAEVILVGESLAESISVAQKMADDGRIFIHPYDDEEIITGQATIGLEILEDLPNPDVVIVPIGGGGLIGGIASAIKAESPMTRIVGVQAAACPSALTALREGKRVSVRAEKSLADGISVKEIGEANFPIIREKVDDIVLVEEVEISSAVLALLERKKILAEGAGAVPLAALLSSKIKVPKGSKVVLVISGGNLDSPLLERVVRQGLLKNGRIMRFSACIEDAPGSLARLLSLVAEVGGNVLAIHHARGGKDLSLFRSRVDLEVETRGFSQIEEIEETLKARGYEIKVKG